MTITRIKSLLHPLRLRPVPGNGAAPADILDLSHHADLHEPVGPQGSLLPNSSLVRCAFLAGAVVTFTGTLGHTGAGSSKVMPSLRRTCYLEFSCRRSAARRPGRGRAVPKFMAGAVHRSCRGRCGWVTDAAAMVLPVLVRCPVVNSSAVAQNGRAFAC